MKDLIDCTIDALLSRFSSLDGKLNFQGFLSLAKVNFHYCDIVPVIPFICNACCVHRLTMILIVCSHLFQNYLS